MALAVPLRGLRRESPVAQFLVVRHRSRFITMSIFLFLLSCLAFGVGVLVMMAGGTVFQEIEGFIFFLISAVFLTGAGIVGAINTAREKFEPLLRTLEVTKPPEPPAAPRPAPAPPVPPPSPAPQPASRPYFVSIDGKDSGPHSLDEVRKLRKVGKLTDETLVIRQGDSEWQAASMFPEISF